MSDLKERILKITMPRQLSSFATLTADGKPWVRYVMTAGKDNMEIRFSSFVGARKVKQIETNPEVHITCGCADPMAMTPYLQIQGLARMTTDKSERHEFWHDMLKNIFDGPDDPEYGIVIVTPYLIEYCSPSSHTTEAWPTEG